MRTVGFWVTGLLTLTLVVGAAVLDVLGEERQRWEASQPPEVPKIEAIPYPEVEPVRITPQVTLVAEPPEPKVVVVVDPSSQPVQTRTHTIVRERQAARRQAQTRPEREPRDDRPRNEPPLEDDPLVRACVAGVCVEADGGSGLDGLLGMRGLSVGE